MTTSGSGLWNEGFGAIGATLKSLEDAGVTPLGLKKIRSNPALAAQIAKLLAGRERRTKYVYPPEYTGLSSITQQVKLLQQKVPAFAELNADWFLNEGQDWYDSLTLPDAVEGPLVKVWDESVGGCHNALDLIFKAIAKERKFYSYREGQLTPKLLRQCERTTDYEHDMKRVQPGDFLIVPSQVGDRWGGYPVREVRRSYNEGEFGHGSVAGGCLILSHPNRLVRFDELDMDFPGDEFEDPDAGDRLVRVPIFAQNKDGIVFGSTRVDGAYGYYGSVTGFLPQ